MQLAEKPEVQSGQQAQPPLDFDLNEVKMLHKTCIEVQKSLRPLLQAPKSKAKAKATPKPADDGGRAEAGTAPPAGEEESKPKRRRMKTAA